MRTASFDEVNPPRGGLPRWALFAASPLVLALGFISGIALSTYWPGVAVPAPVVADGPGALPANPPGTTSPAPALPTDGQSQPDQGSGGLIESPDSRRPGLSSSTLPYAVDETPYLGRTPGPQGGSLSTPTETNTTNTPVAPLKVRTVVDARTALAAEYGSFRVGGSTAFSVDYQLARDINYNTVLIGIVKIAEYGEWVRATRDHPAALQDWLKAAAERVKPAAENEKFTLTWTIYEKVTDPPYGFSTKEVTRDPRGGSYVVTRPLAAVTDVARSVVAVATVDAARPATNDTPWAAYGPVIRFDPTDLYRPTTTKP